MLVLGWLQIYPGRIDGSPFARLEELLRRAPPTGIPRLFARWSKSYDELLCDRALQPPLERRSKHAC